jgi:outer membrane protein assembly factor BamB
MGSRTWKHSSLIGAAALWLVALQALAWENWPNWRGPGLNGVASGTGFPTEWGPTRNVLWKLPLPGRGASTPVVWGDTIVLTFGAEDENFVVAIDRKGNEKFRTAVGKESPGKHKKGTGSNPSAVIDGERIYVYFKSGDFAALDLKGKILWHHNLQQLYGEDTLWWDLGTSPVLTSGAVVVTCMQSGPSYLAAFDRATGKQLWKVDRNLNAPEEAAQSYSTPVVVRDGDNELIYVLGADHITAHLARDGKELWRVGDLNPKQDRFFRSIASPVASGDLLIAPYARGQVLLGVKTGGSGDVTRSHVVWQREGVSADVPTPAAQNGRVYVCTDRGEVACLDAASGKTIWSGNPEPNRNAYSASPILADGKVYVTREDGKTFVLAQGDTFKVLAANALEGEFVVATPVFLDGRIFIRTMENLYCIGEK